MCSRQSRHVPACVHTCVHACGPGARFLPECQRGAACLPIARNPASLSFRGACCSVGLGEAAHCCLGHTAWGSLGTCVTRVPSSGSICHSLTLAVSQVGGLEGMMGGLVFLRVLGPQLSSPLSPAPSATPGALQARPSPPCWHRSLALLEVPIVVFAKCLQDDGDQGHGGLHNAELQCGLGEGSRGMRGQPDGQEAASHPHLHPGPWAVRGGQRVAGGGGEGRGRGSETLLTCLQKRRKPME